MPNESRDLLSIPAALDRALARTVLDEVRATGVGATGGGAAGPAADGDPPPPLASAVTGVVDALSAQGARASEVMLALEDAFAALLAGHDDPAARARVRTLDRQARELVAARLGYGA